MAISKANLDFCSTIVGWALPESRWSHVYASTTCATLSPLCLCSPAAPLSLSAPLSFPLSVTFSP